MQSWKPLYSGFKLGTAAMQFVEKAPWIERFNVNYHLGVDGISLWFVLLTAFINVVVVIASWESITRRVNQYMGAFLILSGLMIGVFCAIDGMLFYVFFEATLIPAYFLIAGFGRDGRQRAAVKFLVYQLAGGLIMLASVIGLYAVSVQATESIRSAALVMCHKRVSCLLILDEGKLVGIVTDRDLRNRVVAAGIDTDLPVTCVMTPDPFTGSADALAFQILMEMTSRNIHHLPILSPDGTPEGVITTTDLMRLEQTNPIYLVGDITQIDLPRKSSSGLIHAARILKDIPEIHFSSFGPADVVRNPLIKKIIRAYERDGDEPH